MYSRGATFPLTLRVKCPTDLLQGLRLVGAVPPSVRDAQKGPSMGESAVIVGSHNPRTLITVLPGVPEAGGFIVIESVLAKRVEGGDDGSGDGRGDRRPPLLTLPYRLDRPPVPVPEI